MPVFKCMTTKHIIGCLFVSNCLLNTGTEKVKVVDENGCHTDADLVPPLDYIQNVSKNFRLMLNRHTKSLKY